MLTKQTIFSGIALFLVVWGVYALTFLGHPIVNDEEVIFDSTESLIHRGDTSLNYHFFNIGLTGSSVGWPSSVEEICSAAGGDPWQSAKYEFIIYPLVAPFLAAALASPDTGNWPIVLYFNVFLTALTASSVYLLARRRGASQTAALIGGILFATGTIAWFYSRQLYREPLAGLFMVWAFGLAALARHYWTQPHRKWWWAVALILSTAGFIATKIVLVVMLPGLFIVLFPQILTWLRKRSPLQIILPIVVVAAIFAGLYVALDQEWLGYGDFYDLDAILDEVSDPLNRGLSLESMLGYQIGPSRSFWIYSPVLLMGLYGAVLLWKQGDYHLVISLVLMLVSFSYFYGWIRGEDWIGTWGWGARYFLPLVPVTVLFWVIPAVEKLLTMQWGKLIIGVAGLLGAAVQLVGMAVPLSNYYTDVFFAGAYYDLASPNREGLNWLDANWTLEWMPLYYHIRNLNLGRFNVAWTRTSGDTLPLVLIALLVCLGLYLIREVLQSEENGRYRFTRLYLLGIALLPAIMISTTVALKDDSEIVQDWPEMQVLVEKLNDSVDSNSILMVDREQYRSIFMNYFKDDAPVVILPYPRAETVDSPVQLSDPIGAQVGHGTVCAVNWSSQTYDRLWLIASSGPFSPGQLRPLERHLTRRYFPVNEITESQQARAIQYLTTYAPTTDTVGFEINKAFGDTLVLAGANLPKGRIFEAGDGLPVSLVWDPRQTPESDYNVGVYLLDNTGRLRAQRDAQPLGGFLPMTSWEAGSLYRDNHGLILPDDLEPGTYDLVVAVYRWQDSERLPVEGTSDNLVRVARIMIQ